MSSKFISVLFLSFICVLTSCGLLNFNQSEEWKVYDEDGNPYVGNRAVVAEPSIPSLIHKETLVIGGSSSHEEKPWVLEGQISNGYLSIDFPNNLELWDEYYSDYTGGVKVARVLITFKDLNSNYLGIHKLDSDGRGIDIYYADGDLTVRDFSGNEYPLHKGWNFIDRDNNRVYQDINELLDLGYRWQLELWDCC